MVRPVIRPVIKSVVTSVHDKYGGFSWQSFWATRTDLFLFFGETSKITGGKLYNQMNGSTDFLTVAGSPNTFQCPNTAAYIAADTDYLWFDLDASLRTVTESELIGYDFPRTIVYYNDDASYTLNAIAILKPGQSVNDRIRDDFHLSIWWDNTLSAFGYAKGNRGIGQSYWTGGYDSHAFALFKRMKAITETPTSARRTNINTTILSLKAANLFHTRFDRFIVYRATGDGSRMMNWIQDALNAEAVANGGTLTQTNDVGVHSDGTKSYIRSHYIPSSDGVLMTLDNASMIFRLSGTLAAADAHGMGVLDGTQATAMMTQRSSTSNYHRINSIISGLTGANYRYIIGMNAVSRSASDKFKLYVANTYDVTAVSTALPTKEMFSLCENDNGTPNYFMPTTEVLEFEAEGASLSWTELGTLNTILNSYIAAL